MYAGVYPARLDAAQRCPRSPRIRGVLPGSPSGQDPRSTPASSADTRSSTGHSSTTGRPWASQTITPNGHDQPPKTHRRHRPVHPGADRHHRPTVTLELQPIPRLGRQPLRHQRRPLHRRLHRRRRRQRSIPGKRITPPPRRTPLLLPDGRNPRPSPGPEKRNPGSHAHDRRRPADKPDPVLNEAVPLRSPRRPSQQRRIPKSNLPFIATPTLYLYMTLSRKTPPQSHTTTDLQPNLQHVPPTPKTRRLRSAPATRYQPPESTRSHILTNRLISYLNSSPHSHPEAPMSTTNSHLQKILTQAEQELTAADYNNT